MEVGIYKVVIHNDKAATPSMRQAWGEIVATDSRAAVELLASIMYGNQNTVLSAAHVKKVGSAELSWSSRLIFGSLLIGWDLIRSDLEYAAKIEELREADTGTEPKQRYLG